MEAHHTAMRELHDQLEAGSITLEEFRTAAAEQREQFESQVREILTEEQYARLEELRCERQAEAAARRLERLDESLECRLDLLTRMLELTEEQVLQVRTILTDANGQWEELLGRVLECEITRQEARQEGHSIMSAATEAIRAVLTEEQRERFDALHELLARHHGPRMLGH
jgi:Spy/CpxP family protein refolding chaperone